MSDILTAEGYEQTKEKLRPGNPCHDSEPGTATRVPALAVSGVAFSPDVKRLATAGGHRGKGEIKIWDSTLWEGKTDH
jgi:hypothetical protein